MITPQEKGFGDGLAGRPMAGESPEYGEAFRRGQLAAAAETGRCMVAISDGCRCPACDAHFIGVVGVCGCERAGEQALVRGLYVLRGPNAMETGFRFMDAGELRAMIATGLPILDMDGADISCQIQLTQ